MRKRLSNRWQRRACALAKLLPVEKWHPAVRQWMAARANARSWAVAFSGGPDSLCLLLLLWACARPAAARLVALHFNHRLRGRAAAADERFCRQVCAALGVRLRTGRWVDAPRHASEDEARVARFRFFDGAMRRAGARALWLGHQQNDIAESMLMRLARGSGPAGLAAPRPIQTSGDRVHLRPLLPLKKKEIVSALRSARIPWREDRTNRSGGYFRTRIRMRVLPAWQRAAGRDALAGAALARELIAEDDAALEAWLAELRPWRTRAVLDVACLQGKPRGLVRRAVRCWLSAQAGAGELSRQGFENLLDAVMIGRPTRRSLGRRGFAVIRDGRLRFQQASPAASGRKQSKLRLLRA